MNAPPGPYLVPPPQAAPARHDGLAIASLVLSLAFLGGLGSLLAVVFGHASRRDARREGRPPSGLATAGLWIGYAGLVLAVLLWVMIIGAFAASYPVSPSP